MRRILAVIAFALACITPVWADDDEEIVVTGTRLEAFDNLQLPHITMKRRADAVIVSLEVRSDTRDFSARRDEMRQALRSLEQRARPGTITLALTDDEAGIVRPFTMAAAEELITADRRPDTSHVSIHLRTPVSPNDSLEAIHARIEAFVTQTPKPGRVEMETGGTDLVLLNPEQYRAPLLRDITADGRAIASELGAGYGVSISELQRQVAWRRTGDLELTLFVPYALAVSPSARP